MKFFLTHLYPKQMSIYGDMGNILALQYRLKCLGWEVVYQPVDMNTNLPKETDFYFIGGGQDKEQYLIFQDLLAKKNRLISDVENGVGLLAICGGYQLLGQSFLTGKGQEVEGINLLPIITKALDSSIKSRCIGNIIIESSLDGLEGRLIGFENHSGQTYFVPQNPRFDQSSILGKTLVGFGNNFEQKQEGCVYKNAVGTYLHGSCLPKNPQLANWLIERSIQTKIRLAGIKIDPKPDWSKIDDRIANLARQSLSQRFLT